MSQVVDQLAELTAFRDRDVVDTTLVTSLRDLLRPLVVTIYRAVGDDQDRRWFKRACLALHDVAASSDPSWTDMQDLPRLDTMPLHVLCMTDRDVWGVLEVCTEEALDVTEHRLVAGILSVYRNFQALLDYSERDTLTGLLNRKTFDEAFYKVAVGQSKAVLVDDNTPLAEAVAAMETERRHIDSSQPHFIGVIDIDHFKSVNDTYGHLIGDEVLLLLSRLMRSVFRFHDKLYRFGGEEFVVLMRCRTEHDAQAAFERFRHAVEGFTFPQVGRITVSVGFTVLKAGDTPSSAFERADRAVYWSKTHGRNQVFNHASLVNSGDLADDAKVGDIELF
jgi:diguanylate cyclase (GGDEF)-like protein